MGAQSTWYKKGYLIHEVEKKESRWYVWKGFFFLTEYQVSYMIIIMIVATYTTINLIYRADQVT